MVELGSRDLPAVASWGEVRTFLDERSADWLRQERLRTAPRRTPQPPVALDQPDVDGPPTPAELDRSGDPMVSVVLPVWNRGSQLRRALDSVQAQTLGSWGSLVVDDGSTDDTQHVLEGFRAFEPRVTVVHQPRTGVSAARNRGIATARGSWVAFLDSDNTWEPDFLLRMTRDMRRSGSHASFAALELHDGQAVSYRAFQGDRAHLLVANHIDRGVHYGGVRSREDARARLAEREARRRSGAESGVNAEKKSVSKKTTALVSRSRLRTRRVYGPSWSGHCRAAVTLLAPR